MCVCVCVCVCMFKYGAMCQLIAADMVSSLCLQATDTENISQTGMKMGLSECLDTKLS